MAFGCSRWTTAGAGSSPPSSIGTECVGWHVCKRGDRFAALQPISMGLAGLYGSTAAGAARGLALRMDHGSQYLSDHFTNQIKFWGIQPSYAFVAEPQTNGVAERFNRTLKEQIIHGRIYRNIAELRDAVRDFVELYNAQWIVEKNGYLSPAQARQAWHAAISISPPRETNLCPRNRVRYRFSQIDAEFTQNDGIARYYGTQGQGSGDTLGVVAPFEINPAVIPVPAALALPLNRLMSPGFFARQRRR